MEKIMEYKDMTEEQQAQIDALNDSFDNNNFCMCGKVIDTCPDAYEHMTQGC